MLESLAVGNAASLPSSTNRNASGAVVTRTLLDENLIALRPTSSNNDMSWAADK